MLLARDFAGKERGCSEVEQFKPICSFCNQHPLFLRLLGFL
jgi:hypothetical protein